MLFKYKGEVGVPLIEMVDDIVDLQRCGGDAIKSNAALIFCIEHKKLTISATNCLKVHCGDKSQCLTNLKKHDTSIHEKSEEKYLGDQKYHCKEKS